MSTLKNRLVTQEREDLGRAVRGLLRSPWVTQAADPPLYDLLMRRGELVGNWFTEYLGWEVVRAPEDGYVRLLKVPGDPVDDGDLRPARRHRGQEAPFDRLRYVLLCIVAGEALDARMVTIGVLADRVASACSADPELLAFRSDRQSDRRAFVDVLVLLERLGALVTVDGQTLQFTDDADAAVLYRVVPRALHYLLSSPRGPSQVLQGAVDVATAIAAMTDETRYGLDHRASARMPVPNAEDPAAPTHVQRTRWARHSLLRKLFDDAAVHREDMTEAERAYASSISGREMVRTVADQAGFALEERADGYLLVDPTRPGRADAFPGEGATSVVGLHLLTRLLGEPDGVTHAALVEQVEEIARSTPRWARSYQDDGGPTRLVDESLTLLAGHLLVRRDGTVLRARPAAARYRQATFARRRQAAPRGSAISLVPERHDDMIDLFAATEEEA